MNYISRIGTLGIETSEKGISAIKFLTQEEIDATNSTQDELLSDKARSYKSLCISALNSYFAKQWGTFNQLRSKIPLDLEGTDFQKKVWSIVYSLPNISPIPVINYSELAFLADKPNSAAECAKICKQNKIPIIIPCHRVIATNNSSGCYACGTDKKLWFLWHEGVDIIKKPKQPNKFLQCPPQAR